MWSDVDDIGAIWSVPDKTVHRNTEILIQKAWEAHGETLKTAVVCPPIIHGRGTGPGRIDSVYYPSLYRASVETGATFYHGSGSNVYSRVHVEDVAQAFLKLIESASRGGQGADWGREVRINALVAAAMHCDFSSSKHTHTNSTSRQI